MLASVTSRRALAYGPVVRLSAQSRALSTQRGPDEEPAPEKLDRAELLRRQAEAAAKERSAAGGRPGAKQRSDDMAEAADKVAVPLASRNG